MKRVTNWIEVIEDPSRKRTQANVVKRERKGRKGGQGAITGLPISRWLALIFEWNEFEAIRSNIDESAKPLTDAQILHNFKLEFGDSRKMKYGKETRNVGGSILSGKHTINFHRSRYRKGELYGGQSKPILVSFRYHQEGYLCSDRSLYKFPSFRECQQICIENKIADPRFFLPEEIEKIEQFAKSEGNFALWAIPTHHELQEIHSQLPITLYRSILTHDLWKKEKVKVRRPRISIDDLNKKAERDEKKEQKELERRRKETKKVVESIDKTPKPSKQKEHWYGGLQDGGIHIPGNEDTEE